MSPIKDKAPTENRRINPKQKRFITEYLISSNGRDAAIKAGYSPRSAHSTSCDILNRPNIAAEIDRRRALEDRKQLVTREQVILGLLFEAQDLTEGTGHKGARVRAWECLGKTLGLFVDRKEISVTGALDVVIQVIQQIAPDRSQAIAAALSERLTALRGGVDSGDTR